MYYCVTTWAIGINLLYPNTLFNGGSTNFFVDTFEKGIGIQTLNIFIENIKKY